MNTRPPSDPVERRRYLDREHAAARLAERNAGLTISPSIDWEEPVDQEWLNTYAEAWWRAHYAPPPPPDFYSPSARRQRQAPRTVRATRPQRATTGRRGVAMSPSASADSGGGSDPDDPAPASAGISHLAPTVTSDLVRVWDEIAGWGGAHEWHFARLVADLEAAQPNRAAHDIIEMAERVAEQADMDFILDQIIRDGVQW